MRRSILTQVFSGDRVFLSIVFILAIGGIAIFSSATLGLLTQANTNVTRMIITQIVFGLGGGIIAFATFRIISISLLRKVAPWLFGLSLLLTILVFIPGLGVYAYGATRWLNLKFITLQPAEFLKVGVVLFVAWFLARNTKRLSEYKYGLLPFLGIIGAPALVLIKQPNTSTILLIGVTAVAMYFVAGAPKRDIGILALLSILLLGAVVFTHPYILKRFNTFVYPTNVSKLKGGYQIRQSLIAIGNGGITGRGFGESVQKFSYLPDPTGDSIFSVYAEEFGFAGTMILVLLFFSLAARGIYISARSHDRFSAYAALGFSVLIATQAFINMGAMLKVIPLTGLPLPFISHGGTALLVVLAESGFILNVAAHNNKKKAKGIIPVST
ncbi:MAG TPA: cell division protein FtsW [Candidatus Kaiserbacteria bacterium]|nr:cell division protein FtsW [Candidatus Kaiserbacteria bacterium]